LIDLQLTYCVSVNAEQLWAGEAVYWQLVFDTREHVGHFTVSGLCNISCHRSSL